MRGRFSSKMRVSRRVSQIRRILDVDTQRLRRKTIRRLEVIFNIASDYARGKIDRVTGEDGKPRSLTILEKQFWARIAAYTAQIINTVAKGIDERQIDVDLDKLAKMIHERKAEAEVSATSEDTGTEKPSGNTERCIISLNDPEKGSNARMWKVTQKLIGTPNSLPKKSEQICPAL